MTVLIAYASIEGQTRKIAEHVAARIESAGRTVMIGDLREPGFLVPGEFDGIILCAPVHMGNYPSAVVDFARDWKDAIAAVPNAFVSVTLSIRSDNAEERAEAEAFPARLAEQTGFRPRLVHHAAGALKYLEYDFFKRYVMRSIARHEGGPVDISRDYEFTDWQALDRFTDDFVATLQRPA